MLNISDLPAISGSALVMGTAPSLLRHDFRSFRGTIFAVGDLPVRAPNLAPYDYWVTANSYYPLPWLRRHRRSMSAANYGHLVFASSAMSPISTFTAPRFCDRLGDLPVGQSMVVYDQRHHDGPCSPEAGCCVMSRLLVKDRPIQEQLEKVTGVSYSGSHSVVFHAIALALLLGAKTVYIAGVDLPFERSNYTYALPEVRLPLGTRRQWLRWRIYELSESLASRVKGRERQQSMFAFGRSEIMNDLESLGVAAQRLGSRLVNLSPTSTLCQVAAIDDDFDYLSTVG